MNFNTQIESNVIKFRHRDVFERSKRKSLVLTKNEIAKNEDDCRKVIYFVRNSVELPRIDKL